MEDDQTGPATTFPPVGPRPAARTGPGQKLQFRGQLLAQESKVHGLREQLQQYDGALSTRKFAADSIVRSQWANRHQAAFTSPEFHGLRDDIAAAGVNI